MDYGKVQKPGNGATIKTLHRKKKEKEKQNRKLLTIILFGSVILDKSNC